ncbi:metallophosphoesterase family protein [Pectinatus haikarae]|uniref:Phosphoesterase n=1 Tax=Pectinatus haikarae TaxID=349096 RepID=A0ABT9YAB6_9FIRM|nr:YfcE family phosphodiesterase [Pectinatus haikarae]MDQ0204435.1 putative phosphoesterase [Pectinatus haikarae]
MIAGVISDSHGNTMAVKKAIEKAPFVDIWLHAGDYVQDAAYLEKMVTVPVIKVAGNGDWNNTAIPEDKFFVLENKKIWLTHGHKYQVKWGIDYLSELAGRNRADIVIFGHSHVYCEKYEKNRLFLNPGSISLPRDGKEGSFAILELYGDKNLFQVNRYTI